MYIVIFIIHKSQFSLVLLHVYRYYVDTCTCVYIICICTCINVYMYIYTYVYKCPTIYEYTCVHVGNLAIWLWLQLFDRKPMSGCTECKTAIEVRCVTVYEVSDNLPQFPPTIDVCPKQWACHIKVMRTKTRTSLSVQS